jgi:hypothetical protein
LEATLRVEVLLVVVLLFALYALHAPRRLSLLR